MSLQLLKTLTDDQRNMLAADKWTVRGLAGIKPETLTAYKGIGKATARRIVAEAKRVLPQLPEIKPEPETPPMSARVKRIQAQ